MGLVAETHGMVDGMVRSHRERSDEVAARHEHVNAVLAETGRERVREENNLRRALAADAAARRRSVADMRSEFAADVAARKRSVANMLSENRASVVSSTKAQNAALDAATKARARDVHALRAANLSELSAQSKQVAHDLAEAESKRNAAQFTLRGVIAEGRFARKRTVIDLLLEDSEAIASSAKAQHEALVSATNARAHDVHDLRSANQSEDSARHEQVSDLLAQDRSALTSMAQAQHEELVAVTKQRADDVRKLRDANLSELNEAASVWPHPDAASGNAAPPAAAEGGEPARTADRLPLAIIEPANTPPVSASGSETASPPSPVTKPAKSGDSHRRGALEGSIFSFLAVRPDGASAQALESALNASSSAVATILQRLIEENRVRKDEQRDLYFAT
jgi:hypothetical protein